MTVIEGIGDELVITAFVVAALVMFVVAWMSTFVCDPPEIANHVTPSGVVSQNLDFPGSIEDDLERIANEIEEEAEAVENEISVLTLQRTAFLQTLTNPGEARRSDEGDEDDGDEGDDDDVADRDAVAEDRTTDRPARPSPSTQPEEEPIPTFEFPCPHEEEAFSATATSSAHSSRSAGLRDDAESPRASSTNSAGGPFPPTSIPIDSIQHYRPQTLIAESSSSSSATSRSFAGSDTSAVNDSTTSSSATSISSEQPTSEPSASSSSPSSTSIAPEAQEMRLRRRNVENNGVAEPVVTGDPCIESSPPDADTRSGGTSVAPSDGHMTVRIKFLNDVIREMRVKSTDTIRDFKATFFAEELAALNRVRLIFNGQMLSDHLSFGHYNITNNTVIHCLVSRGGAVNGGGANGSDDGRAAGAVGGDDVIMQELDLSRLVFPLVAVILSCVWYFRVQYRQLFNATSSFALLFLTGVFFFFVFTSLRNRAAVAAASGNNNSNNDRGANNNNNNNNNDGTDNANRPSGVAASS